MIVKMNRLGLIVAAMVLAASASTCLACGEEAKANEAKDAPVAAAAAVPAVANANAPGCDKPCCAHANDGAKPAVLVAADQKNAAEKDSVMPCAAAGSKGCPKKAAATGTAVAKAEPVQDTAKAAPAADSGTKR